MANLSESSAAKASLARLSISPTQHISSLKLPTATSRNLPPTPTSMLPSNQTASELLAFVAQFDPSTLQSSTLDIYSIEVQLHKLKTLGREASISNQLTPEIANNLVSKFILPNISNRATHEALTIIANGLVLNNSLLSTFDPLPVFSLVLQEYAKPGLPLKENYLLGRLLFLFTFNGIDLSDTLLSSCIDAIHFKTSIILENVHALTSIVAVNPLVRLSFIELMKFVFNLIHHYPDRAIQPLQDRVMENLSYVFLSINTTTLLNVDISRYLFNTLMCVSVDSWFNNSDHMPLLLNNILDYCHLVTSPENVSIHNENTLSPAFTCLQLVVSHIWNSMESPDECKRIVRSALLPTEKDRELALGNSDSLASHFVGLSTDITVQSCNRIVQEIYWVVFDRNQQALNEVMGFGFASGFLSANSFLDGTAGGSPSSFLAEPRTRKNSTISFGGAHDDDLFSNLPTSRRDSSSSDASMTKINPITGQYLHSEAQDERRQQAQREWDTMTEEEKEIEGERMFTLLDRLKDNGMIKPIVPTSKLPPMAIPQTSRVGKLGT